MLPQQLLVNVLVPLHAFHEFHVRPVQLPDQLLELELRDLGRLRIILDVLQIVADFGHGLLHGGLHAVQIDAVFLGQRHAVLLDHLADWHCILFLIHY